jgi:hypothetical protein
MDWAGRFLRRKPSHRKHFDRVGTISGGDGAGQIGFIIALYIFKILDFSSLTKSLVLIGYARVRDGR